MNTHVAITRVIIEMTTPLTTGSGRRDEFIDLPFATDANGLPALPGTSLAGALRAAFRRVRGERATEEIFGFQRSDDGSASRIWVSWGHVLDAENQAIEGLTTRRGDVFLATLAGGEVRDHVRISHRGAVDGHGKFDRQVVLPGTRFAFLVTLWGASKDELHDLRDELLSLLGADNLRLGAAIHSGFGAFSVVNVSGSIWDLRQQEDFEAFSKTSGRLDDPGLPDLPLPQALSNDDEVRISVSLRPETFFVFGGGDAMHRYGDDPKPPDLNAVRGRRVVWTEDGGRVSEPAPYAPGSSIKGALAHRTAFHLNRQRRRFAHDVPLEELDDAVHELFGSAADDEEGTSGRVRLDDIPLDAYEPRHRQRVMHTSIDRFSGGVRNRVLFSEEVLSPDGPELTFDVVIEKYDEIPDEVLEAFRRALTDLTTGRLSLGHGDGRGNGRFVGEFQWPARANDGGRT